MARERSQNRDKAFELYKESNGEIQNREIANILGIPEKTVSAWKSRYKWAEEVGVVLQKSKCSTTSKKNTSKKKKEPIAKEVEEIIERDGLTDKQRLFCIYYVKLFNATKAYQKAYGCDYVSAMTNGSRALRNDKIREEIERIKTERMNGAFLSTEDILQKYIDIAFADISDFIDVSVSVKEKDDGTLVRWNSVLVKEEFDGAIVTQVSQGKDGISLKLADKMRALDFLAKYNGMLSTDVKEKLDIEREKLAIMKRKDAPEDEEVEDDGFIAALSDQVESVWDDE